MGAVDLAAAWGLDVGPRSGSDSYHAPPPAPPGDPRYPPSSKDPYFRFFIPKIYITKSRFIVGFIFRIWYRGFERGRGIPLTGRIDLKALG